MTNKAIIIAANPKYGEGGDPEIHKKHSESNGKVFWYLIPPGRRDIPWANPKIEKGYFYISGTDEIQYKFLIDDARRISDFKEANLQNEVKKYIPYFREWRWSDSGSGYVYAVLIKNISKIHGIPIEEFELVNTRKPLERVQNYVIVFDRQTEEVLT